MLAVMDQQCDEWFEMDEGSSCEIRYFRDSQISHLSEGVAPKADLVSEQL
jgi:hypothetical protein